MTDQPQAETAKSLGERLADALAAAHGKDSLWPTMNADLRAKADTAAAAFVASLATPSQPSTDDAKGEG